MLIRMIMFSLCTAPILAQSDIWVSNQSGNGSNLVYINDGKGRFSDSQQTLGNSLSLAAAYGDLDGDGDIDVVDAADPGCWVYLNDGQGNLTQSAGFGADLPIVRSVALVDVNDDDHLDVILGVAVSQFTSSSQVFLNNGSAQFSFLGNVGSQDTRSIAVANLNDDDFPDIYEANRGEADRIWINDGNGSFTDSGQLLSSLQSFSVALGDVDNDDDLDALVAIDGGPNQLWLNDGFANFSASAQVFTSAHSLSCAFGDVDQDGDLDAVVGNDGAINSDPLEIWINDGSGVFTRTSQTSPAFRTLGLSFGDIDGDGHLDLHLANFGEDRVYRNNGSGLFSETPQILSSGLSNGGLLVYLRDNFDGAIANWDAEYTVLGLLQFQLQLTAEFDYRRGR